MENKTLVVNLYAGPGAGKSTTRAGLFHQLKMRNLNVEEVPEYAKDLTWEERYKTLECQPYIFGKQFRNVWRLIGKVDAIITDSPFNLCCIYSQDDTPQEFIDSVMAYHNSINTCNVFINRVKPYNPKGRNQDESGAREIDQKVKEFLYKQNIPFLEINGDEQAPIILAEIVENLISLK